MSVPAQVLTLLIALGAVATVLSLVRRHRLKERYAFIWLMVAVGMLALVIARPLLDRISESLGIQSGTSTLFLLATLAILGILLQLSISLTKLEEKMRDIAEAVALSGDTVEESNDRTGQTQPESQ